LTSGPLSRWWSQQDSLASLSWGIVVAWPNPVFFNRFAAAEPSANVCVAHGTRRNDTTFRIATTA